MGMWITFRREKIYINIILRGKYIIKDEGLLKTCIPFLSFNGPVKRISQKILVMLKRLTLKIVLTQTHKHRATHYKNHSEHTQQGELFSQEDDGHYHAKNN